MNINPAAGTTDYFDVPKIPKAGKNGKGGIDTVDISEQIRALRGEMFTAAEALDFERAARLRDELKRLEGLAGKEGVTVDIGPGYDPYAGAPKKAKSRSRSSTSGNAASKARAGGGGRGKR
jgi:excinuclease ABC subunit B